MTKTSQTIIIKKKSSLCQGSIFSINRLKFSTEKGKQGLPFFYPRLELRGIKFGMIVNQSCDLVKEKKSKRNPKVPFLSVAFLEPFERELKYIKSKALDDSLVSVAYNGNSFSFVYKDRLLDAASELLSQIIKNEHPWLYFVCIKDKDNTSCYCINLTKVFPIRIEHYDTILRREKYQLKPPYEQKLGWKIAELYGRVGTPDLDGHETKILTNQLFEDTINYVTQKAFLVTKEQFIELARMTNPPNDPRKREKFDVNKQQFLDNLLKELVR